jgi:hypothetical protein
MIRNRASSRGPLPAAQPISDTASASYVGDAMGETKRLVAILDALRVEPDVLAMRNAQGYARRGGRGVHFGLGQGSADIICLVGPQGLFVALEVKEPGQEPSPAQRAWLNDVARLGGAYAVVSDIAGARLAIAGARILSATYARNPKGHASAVSSAIVSQSKETGQANSPRPTRGRQRPNSAF